MKNFFDTLCDYIPIIVLALFLIILVGSLIISTVIEMSKTEVDSYTTECEVTQVAYAEKASGRSSSRATYKLGIRNDEICTAVDITAEQFAMFAVGDTVKVQVTVYEKLDGTQQTTYKIIDYTSRQCSIED